MGQPTENIRILEVAETNLIQIISDNESDATYYSKSNLEVSALDGKLVIKNEGVVVLSAFPYEILEPKEESVVDLAEIIQSYINNILSEVDEEVEALKELIDGQKNIYNLLEQLHIQSKTLSNIKDLIKVTNKILTKIYQ
jgi:hypothetical protein